MNTTIHDIIQFLERIAPPAYQESYDNCGLLCGDRSAECRGALLTLDCTEAVVDEAIAKHCNLIIAHHPIIFRGLKKLTGNGYVERTVLKAIRNDIAIYAIHTNLDNVHTGVNKQIADLLGLKHTRVLVPKNDTLGKLVTFVPVAHTEQVLNALHAAGAGNIGNYSHCSFRVEGTGTFKPESDANPVVGTHGVQEFVKEDRIEVVFPLHLEREVLKALRSSHPYEEVAFYISTLRNEHQEVGAGMVGELDEAEEPMAFLKRLKTKMNASIVRHTPVLQQKISKVAVCGGSGASLISAAIRSGAQVFVTSDVKYHEFFEADNRIIIADIGHYESEAFTKELLMRFLTEKFPTFAFNFSTTVTNPISYL